MVVEKGCSWCDLVLCVNDAGIKNRISSWSKFKCELSILLKKEKKMKKKHLYFSGQSKVLYNEEENLIFVLSNPLIAREPDVRHAFCAADADPGVRGQGWSSDPGSPPGEGVPSSDLVPCQGQMTPVRLCWLWSQPGGNQGGESCQSSGTAIESSRLRLFFLPLSPQVDVDKA